MRYITLSGRKSLKNLAGKKVWVIQFDDDENSVIGVVEGIENGFIALRMDHESEPTLYVNLQNVKEIEVCRANGDGELRLLRFPDSESRDKGPRRPEL